MFLVPQKKYVSLRCVYLMDSTKTNSYKIYYGYRYYKILLGIISKQININYIIGIDNYIVVLKISIWEG